MNAPRIFAFLALAVPLYGNAQALSLEEFCNNEYFATWEPASSTCTTDAIYNPRAELVYIRRHESLHLFGFESILGFIVNAGTVVMDGGGVHHFNSLVNTGTFVTTAGTDAALGNLNRNPLVNSGVVESAGTLFILSPMENQGHIENSGTIETDDIVLENLGHIANDGGTLINHGRINNYRCPGATGVVTAGGDNIVNEGEIYYITGRDC